MRTVLPDGTALEVFGLSGLVRVDRVRPPEWALYLDDRWRDEVVEWPCRFVDWPDFGLPIDEADAFDAFVEAFRRAQRGEIVDMACDGGTGRSGTALACVAVLAGVPPGDSVAWVREHYHRWAVEVSEQEQLVSRFGAWARTTGQHARSEATPNETEA